MADEPSSKLQKRMLPVTGHQITEMHKIRHSVHHSIPLLIVGPFCCGKTFLIQSAAAELGRSGDVWVLNAGEQTDAKALLGAYTVAPGKPGRFKWRPGVVFEAATSGKWLLVEDLQLASDELLSILRPLVDSKAVFSSQVGENVCIHPQFRLFATISGTAYSVSLPRSFWTIIHLHEFDHSTLLSLLPPRVDQRFVADLLNKMTLPTGLIFRLASRLSLHRYSLDNDDRLKMLLDAIDLFAGHLPHSERRSVVESLSHVLCIPTAVALEERHIEVSRREDCLCVGRASLCIGRASLPVHAGHPAGPKPFVMTKLSSRVLEQIACCVQMAEPVLLTGETGTGKTSIVQHLASLAGATLEVINMSQQSEASDLVGGFQPFSPQLMARQISDAFVAVFVKSFSKAKNTDYLGAISTAFKQSDWARFTRLVRQIVDKVKQGSAQLAPEWHDLDVQLAEFEQCRTGLVFHFRQGSLVEAIQRGRWILLDEINLATPETLNILSALLRDSQSSITLSERGDTAPVPRHPHFRLFACMNPATDVGKKLLPHSIRRRFTELFVDEADAVPGDLLLIISSLLGPALCNVEDALPPAVASLYYALKEGVESGQLVDGSRRRPLFNLRTLTRAVRFALKAASLYGIRWALREGFWLSFVTQLDGQSKAIAGSIIDQHIAMQATGRIIAERWTRQPSLTVFEHYVIETGPRYDAKKSLGQVMSELEGQFVLTDSVKEIIKSIARGVMAADHPILLEGPTSSGKTSSIEYLAQVTGHRFSRINNHEHTDLQEYLGSFVINSQGQLSFKEGLLLTALREGHWLVLDELNLAPSDVLEALNRLLDDNRELLVAELSEVVRPHPHFRLFATQNPANSVYGGRKALSRAFRSRFVELTIADIPVDELEVILCRKAKIAPSQAKKLTTVYSLLQQERAVSANVFAGRHALVTLRDLFRWANRPHTTNEDLARMGFVCLAERMRSDAERALIASIICKVFKMQSIDPLPHCAVSQDYFPRPRPDLPVWTASMRRLFWLVSECIKAKEPVLLVGETGCGKTTVAQVIAQALQCPLTTVNCHQNTESSDLLGSQRPARCDSDELFVWTDGPLIQSMRQGGMLLIDEISLADDSVLERLNSVLEPGRQITLAEAPGCPVVTAHPSFALIATMNPGGDYGKKELSPALCSRFTEIWVPAVVDQGEIHEILASKLPGQHQVCLMIEQFWSWLASIQPTDCRLNRQTPSLRDLNTWIDFVKVSGLPPRHGFTQGAEMLFVDRLEDERLRASLMGKLREIAGDSPVIDHGVNQVEYVDDGKQLRIGPYCLPVSDSHAALSPVDHQFCAPTTLRCAVRCARALQLHRPVLLEGSPGVGKSALVTALAAACQVRLCRINLSEQTDLSDLFGADLPVDGGAAGQFAWRDGPFLAALKAGDWILLDELNLASQSVLEGLNACLDHRATVYIPELNKSFTVSQRSRLFAAQNPASQGGGRNGLPRSFLNRFTIVWFDRLHQEDYRVILRGKYPHLQHAFIDRAIQFDARLNAMIAAGALGRLGGPWEFNLRDLFRWFDLATQDGGGDLGGPVKMIYEQRFRTAKDRLAVRRLAGDVLEADLADFYWNIKDDRMLVGKHQLCRPPDSSFQLLHSHKEILESLVTAVGHRMMVLLVGQSGTGKSRLIEFCAGLVGKKVHCLTLSPSTDTLDILGTFEQADQERRAAMAGSSAAAAAPEPTEGRFEWFDGPLVRALEHGHWLVLDHANMASPSVLDRINCLLEPDGQLVLSEQGVDMRTGRSRCIKPHPDFRLFMTVQTDCRVEISRAMRNRGVELCVLSEDGGHLMDCLSVMRSVCRESRNGNLPLPRACKDLREAHNFALMKEGGAEGAMDELSDADQFWKDCMQALPVSVSDGSDHVELFSRIVLLDAPQGLQEAHRRCGFKPLLGLLKDHEEMVKGLHPSGLVWKAACHWFGCTSDAGLDEGVLSGAFMGHWRTHLVKLSIKRTARAAAFDQLCRAGNCSVDDYLSLWADAGDLLVSHEPDAGDIWDAFVVRLQEYAVLKAGSSAHPARNLIAALGVVDGDLQAAFRWNSLFRDLQVAHRMLWNSHLSSLLKEFVKLFSECSVNDYGRCLSMVDTVKGLLNSAKAPLQVAIDPHPGFDALLSFVEWICEHGDPNEHLLAHSRILSATAALQQAECTLQRRFLKIWRGGCSEHEDRHAAAAIEHLQGESSRCLTASIEPSNARPLAVSLVKNASAYLRRVFGTPSQLEGSSAADRQSVAQSLIGLRSSLMGQSATCFDLTIPIVKHLDVFLFGLLSQEPPPADVPASPVEVLREAAIRACSLGLPVVLSKHVLERLVAVALKRTPEGEESGVHKGVRDDLELETEIEAEFFNVRELGVCEADVSVTIQELVHVCVRPEGHRVHKLLAEQAFHRSLSQADHGIDVDGFLAHLLSSKCADRPPSYYDDSQPEMLLTARAPVQSVLDKACSLLDEFPGHDVLETVRGQCEQFLYSTPVHQTPLAAASIVLERLVQKATDWEQYACKQFSVKAELDRLMQVVIEYRKSQLDSWRQVFDQLLAKYRRKAALTWPFVAELCLIHTVQPEVYPELVKVVEEYLMSGELGQFAFRMSILEDAVTVCQDRPLQRLLAAVWHYFKPISEHLASVIASHREPLESDMKAYLKTIHWSVANYWAMRTSVNRSHRKMAQFIRKCRELLDRPVSSVLVSHPFVPKLSLEGERGGLVCALDAICDAMESRMAEVSDVDDVAQKQRAVLNYLAVAKGLGVRLSHRSCFDKCADTKAMLVLAAEAAIDLPSFTNCLHQFTRLHTVAVTKPHPDLGVRVMESFQACSGQLLLWMHHVLEGVALCSERTTCGITEGLYRVTHGADPESHVSVSNALAHNMLDEVCREDYQRIFSNHHTPIMVKRNGAALDALQPSTDAFTAAGELVERLSCFEDELKEALDVDGQGEWSVRRVVDVLCALKAFLAHSHPLFLGTKGQLRRAEKLMLSIDGIVKQVRRSLHKFVFVSLTVMCNLLQNGYCRQDDSSQQQTGEQDAKEDTDAHSGLGMAAGEQGERNVNEELEFEEQVTGLQSDAKADDPPVEKEDNEIEMQQDFDAELEKLMIDDDKEGDEDEEGGEDDFDDKETDKVDSDAEKQEMDQDWESGDDNGDDDQVSMDEELEKGHTKDELVAEEGKHEPRPKEGQSSDDDDDDSTSHEGEDDDASDDDVSDAATGGNVMHDDDEDDDVMHEDDDVMHDTHDNPNPDAEYDSNNQQQQFDAQTGTTNQEELMTKAFDGMGPEQFESEAVESNVVENQPRPTSPPSLSTEPSTAKTVHDILDPTVNDGHQQLQGSHERQQYEQASKGQTVTGRSVDKASSTPQQQQQQSECHSQDVHKRSLRDAAPRPAVGMDATSPTGVQQQSTAEEAVAPRDEDVMVLNHSALQPSIESLANELCERLRIVLEPTERTRMQGDYRTGKRLNLRKIIPFIASGYKRDKIWMRRSRPAKRNYTILLCVDQSRSMRDGNAHLMAHLTLAALSTGLGRLEAGRVSSLGFGESVRPFDADRSQWTDEKSDFSQLLDHLLVQSEEEEDAGLGGEGWKLALIISDGICQEHDKLRAHVNRCLEARILPLLVILDPLHKISELSHVHYEADSGKVKFTRYLNTVPFEHYIIVHELKLLPQLLAEALQQWFQIAN